MLRPAILAFAALCACGGPARAQFAGRAFLASTAGVGVPGAIFELALDGTVLATHPGPAAGVARLLLDLPRARLYMLDSGGTQLSLLDPATGRRAQIAVSGGRDLALRPDGRLLLVHQTGGFGSPGSVQEIDPQGGAWPAPVPLAPDPREALWAPGGILWVRHGVPNQISRVSGGVVSNIPLAPFSATAAQGIAVFPDGGVAVSFLASGLIQFLDAAGLPRTALALPEPALRMSADRDRHLWVLGPTRVFSVDVPRGQLASEVLLPPGLGAVQVHAHQGYRFWIEEGTTPALRHWSGDGVFLGQAVLPRATATAGDPFGLDAAILIHPGGDRDLDGHTNLEEFRRGTSLMHAGDAPADLYVGPGVGGVIPLVIHARSAPLGLGLLLLGITPAGPGGVGLGPDGGAPYFALASDPVAQGLWNGGSPLAPFLISVPWVPLDASGIGFAALDAGALGLPPGVPVLYAGALVVGLVNSHFSTTNLGAIVP
jgi:hypothetical protein